MANLVLLVGFVVWAYCGAIGRVQTGRGAAVLSALAAAVLAGGTGFVLAVREDARSRYGVVTTGTIVEKLSSSGEQGTRTFGPSRFKIVRTSEGYSFHEIVARKLVTGSTAAYVIDYRYSCGRPAPCWGREFIDHDRWRGLQRGDRVDVRWVPDGFGGARLDGRTRWPEAFIQMGLGGLMLLAAWGVAATGPLSVPKRKREGATCL